VVSDEGLAQEQRRQIEQAGCRLIIASSVNGSNGSNGSLE
jgi:hypothetical protein